MRRFAGSCRVVFIVRLMQPIRHSRVAYGVSGLCECRSRFLVLSATATADRRALSDRSVSRASPPTAVHVSSGVCGPAVVRTRSDGACFQVLRPPRSFDGSYCARATAGMPLVHKLWPRLRPISACPQRERQHDRKSLAQRLLSQIHARECNPVQFTVSVILSHTKTSASGRSVASPLLMEPACVEDAIDTVGVVGQSVAAVIGGECRE